MSIEFGKQNILSSSFDGDRGLLQVNLEKGKVKVRSSQYVWNS